MNHAKKICLTKKKNIYTISCFSTCFYRKDSMSLDDMAYCGVMVVCILAMIMTWYIERLDRKKELKELSRVGKSS